MSDAAPRPRSSAEPPDGSVELSTERRREAYRWMVLARAIDERCLSLQRQGRIGFYAPLAGQEAAQIGAAFALRAEDWVFPAYRELSVALVRGVSLKSIFDQLLGNSEDVTKGRQMPNHFAFRPQNYVSASSPIGTQITHAVGAAMAAQRRRDAVVTITFFGDGATSSNDFHAGLNFAGVFRTPTIFFCQNNEWAISLPRERQTASATLAAKAEAYGFPGVVVDGNDVDAVYRATAEARRRAIAGEGPTMIEAQVYRFGPHSTSDDPRRYRSDEEVARAKKNDPVLRLKNRLMLEGQLDAATDEKLWETTRGEVLHAFEASEKLAPLDPRSLFDDVLATSDPGLEEEREGFDRFSGGRS